MGRSKRLAQGCSSREHGIRKELVLDGSTSSTTDYFKFALKGQAIDLPSPSLQEQARNTEAGKRWKSDLRLRYARVAFVKMAQKDLSSDSTGAFQKAETNLSSFSKPITTDKLLQGDCIATLNLQDPFPAGEFASIYKRNIGFPTMELTGEEDRVFGDEKAEIRETSFTDTGSSPAGHLPQSVVPRCASPSTSDSSEEIIVFPGRNHIQSTIGNKYSLSSSPSTNETLKPVLNELTQQASSWCPSGTPLNDPIGPNSRFSRSSLGGCRMDNSQSNQRGFLPSETKSSQLLGRQKNFQDEIFADYIANIDNDEDCESSDADIPALGLENGSKYAGNAAWQDEIGISSSKPNYLATKEEKSSWGCPAIADPDDLSASGEDVTVIKSVLSRRSRSSGIQYLVIAEGNSVDNARWIPPGSLAKSGGLEQIKDHETKQLETRETSTYTDESDNEVFIERPVDIDLQNELDDMRDEQDLIESKIARISDENLARLLSKKEELAIASDDHVLFFGDESDLERKNPSSPRDERWHPLRSVGTEAESVSSASYIANVFEPDSYHEFDVMDHSRSSLQVKSKRRRGKLMIEAVDTDIENSLELAWNKDRAKKRIRKREREEHRQLNIFGRKGNAKPYSKFNESMSMAMIQEEIKTFLSSSLDNLPLPPMQHKHRKMVHEIANALRLTSKSTGSGKSRFPVLYKTGRTRTYDKSAIDAIVGRVNSARFSQRAEKSSRKSSKVIRRGPFSGFNNAGVSYRDGEIVGAAAPELGEENKGRAMLEKMGWSTGTALGALNNKGIIEPVAHVVKTTKAGLG